MIWLLTIVIVLTWCEVLWDSYHEVKLNQGPDYSKSNMIRVAVGAVFWLISPVIYPSMNWKQFLLIPVISVPLFSFIFDWGLNIMRNHWGIEREYYYLGQKNKLDIWQREHGGAKLWFYLKLVGVLVLLTIFVLLKS
jgi:hypothetical protein